MSSRLKKNAGKMTESDAIVYRPIGIVRSPVKEPRDALNQPHRGKGISGTIVLNPDLREALDDLEGFSHIILLCHLHLSRGFSLKVIPHRENEYRGMFATRTPRRPNPIGLSVVRLDRIEGNVLHISNLDIIDGTPVLDIKPFVPHFDDTDDFRIGWLTGRSSRTDDGNADDRFHREE